MQHSPMYVNQTFMFELAVSGNRLAYFNLKALAVKYPEAHIGRPGSFISSLQGF